MSAGLNALKHIVVLMMENRSFDHMLGGLKAENARINGLTGHETNLDNHNEPAPVKSKAATRGQLDPDPDHHFPAVHKQLYLGTTGPPAAPSMGGFVQSYWDKQNNVEHSRQIMYYFAPDALPVLHALAREYAVFNGWFSSIPGPTVCNRAFAHYGTSFGQVSLDIFYLPLESKNKIKSIYDRMLGAGRTARIYYFDPSSSTQEVVNILKEQPKIFGTYKEFIDDCRTGNLPDYCFVEPNYSDHPAPDGAHLLASDQHPDHDVMEGENFIASIYNAIRQNPDLWKSTALLITYDEHGGIYDHVAPPSCNGVDGFHANPAETGDVLFAFDRLGVRVPAILVSPWIARGTVVAGTEDPKGRAFEHASIPATVTSYFIGNYDLRTDREKKAATFLDLLGDTMRSEKDCPVFYSE
jgi:phospholipase C